MKNLIIEVPTKDVINEEPIAERRVIQETIPFETELNYLNPLDFDPACSIKSPDAISAINRATTQKCKEELVNISCLIQSNKLYPKKLPSFCHLRGKH